MGIGGKEDYDKVSTVIMKQSVMLISLDHDKSSYKQMRKIFLPLPVVKRLWNIMPAKSLRRQTMSQ